MRELMVDHACFYIFSLAYTVHTCGRPNLFAILPSEMSEGLNRSKLSTKSDGVSFRPYCYFTYTLRYIVETCR